MGAAKRKARPAGVTAKKASRRSRTAPPALKTRLTAQVTAGG